MENMNLSFVCCIQKQEFVMFAPKSTKNKGFTIINPSVLLKYLDLLYGNYLYLENFLRIKSRQVLFSILLKISMH